MTIETRIYDLLAAHETPIGGYCHCVDCAPDVPDTYRTHIAELLTAELFPLIETLESLDALPVGTVVKDGYPHAMTKLNDGWYCCAGGGARRAYSLPARVIDRPEMSET